MFRYISCKNMYFVRGLKLSLSYSLFAIYWVLLTVVSGTFDKNTTVHNFIASLCFREMCNIRHVCQSNAPIPLPLDTALVWLPKMHVIGCDVRKTNKKLLFTARGMLNTLLQIVFDHLTVLNINKSAIFHNGKWFYLRQFLLKLLLTILVWKISFLPAKLVCEVWKNLWSLAVVTRLREKKQTTLDQTRL